MPRRTLTDRVPSVRPERALAELVVPPAFAAATTASYVPHPDEPSQADARAALESFTRTVGRPPPRRRLLRRPRLTGRAPDPVGAGVYLDGGFGVGKTHLLAAAAHAVDGPVAFGTFVQYTALVGALGFGATRDALADRALVCIDEFELDDPGDTVMMSTLLGELAAAGVALAATSNTLPGALGEQRFAAADFAREIQGLAARFRVVHIDGPDHRHRDSAATHTPADADGLTRWAEANDAATDDFGAVLSHLARVHPAAYGELMDDVPAVAWRDVTPLPDQNAALRLVVLVDRLYDRGIPVAASGTPLTDVFDADMLAGGHRKKYGRARSRLAALAGLLPAPD